MISRCWEILAGTSGGTENLSVAGIYCWVASLSPLVVRPWGFIG